MLSWIDVRFPCLLTVPRQVQDIRICLLQLQSLDMTGFQGTGNANKIDAITKFPSVSSFFSIYFTITGARKMVRYIEVLL